MVTSPIGTAMRYEGWSGISPDAGKPPREEVATPVPIAGDVEGTGTGSIRAPPARWQAINWSAT
jgi:hypothetical protein